MDTPDIDGFRQVTAKVIAGDSASAYWDAYTEDPKGNISTVRCLTERTSVTSTGKQVSEEVLNTFLYKIDEERLYIDNNWARICLNLGIYVNLGTTPPSLVAPYAGPGDWP
jgi:hypothetical protein